VRTELAVLPYIATALQQLCPTVRQMTHTVANLPTGPGRRLSLVDTEFRWDTIKGFGCSHSPSWDRPSGYRKNELLWKDAEKKARMED